MINKARQTRPVTDDKSEVKQLQEPGRHIHKPPNKLESRKDKTELTRSEGKKQRD